MCEFCFEGEGVAVKISCAVGLGIRFFAFLSFIIRLNLDATPFQLFMGT